MRKGYYLAVFVVIVIGFGSVFYLSQDPVIEVYGGEQAFRITESGNLKELTEHLTESRVDELIVKNKEMAAVIICGELFSEFSLKKKGRSWLLQQGSSRAELAGVTKIFLATRAKDQGVYHLNGTGQLSYQSTYDLIRRNIVLEDLGSRDYQRGFLTIPEVLLTIQTEADSLLFIYHNGVEEWHKPKEPGLVKLTAKQLLPAGVDRKGEKVLKGIWENPPSMSGLMIYDLLMSSIAESPTLAVFVDGLGYKLWEYASEKGFSDTFFDIGFEPLRVVYPPKTVYNYYAFGTGELRPEAEEKRKEMFSSFAEPGLISFETETGTAARRGVIIEGEMQLYLSPLRQVLHLPDKESGLVDPAIYRTALKETADHDFVFVHFHDIDDLGHSYGPNSKEVMEAIRRTGAFLTGLAAVWEGNFYVFSDHGMHEYYEEETGSLSGTHYTAGAEDMIGVFADLSGLTKGEDDED
jgi:hypothetical protein